MRPDAALLGDRHVKGVVNSEKVLPNESSRFLKIHGLTNRDLATLIVTQGGRRCVVVPRWELSWRQTHLRRLVLAQTVLYGSLGLCLT